MPHESSMRETRVLLSGFGMGESPRWHDGRLWFSNWGTDEIVAVDLDGNSEVMERGGGGSGWAANWLLDGRMLITGDELIRIEPDGSRVRHADLSDISPYGWSEITVDGRGNIYVNSINFDFADFNDILASGKAPRKIALVMPDGDAREVADDLAFPNGMVVTPARLGRRWFGPFHRRANNRDQDPCIWREGGYRQERVGGTRLGAHCLFRSEFAGLAIG
jgi:sugar lactone lactonase YvrE